MSVSINIKDAVKRYGNNTIIPDLSLTIREGEFFYAAWAVRLRKDYVAANDCRLQQY